MFKDVLNFKRINKLKSIYRANSVDTRKESAAEHTWSCLMLADFLLPRVKKKLNKLRVYELLLYHDLVEIEAGDTPMHPGTNERNKEQREQEAARKLKKQLPKATAEKFFTSFKEFEAQKTNEAKFSKIIDALDAEIHELDYKEDWKGWTEEYLRKKKEPYFKEFPELKPLLEELMLYLRKKGYFQVK